MSRTSIKLIGAIMFLTAGGSAAFAQGTIAQQDACRTDVFRLCNSYIPDVGQIVACLRGNAARLSAPCHDVMFEQQASQTQGYASPSRIRQNWNQ